jgi:hypothetical protein
MTQRLMTVAELEDTSPPNRSDPLYVTLDALVTAREAAVRSDNIEAFAIHDNRTLRRFAADRKRR